MVRLNAAFDLESAELSCSELERIGRVLEGFSQLARWRPGHGADLARQVCLVGKAHFGGERGQRGRRWLGQASQRGLHADDAREALR
jgi:hypothetical protein